MLRAPVVTAGAVQRWEFIRCAHAELRSMTMRCIAS